MRKFLLLFLTMSLCCAAVEQSTDAEASAKPRKGGVLSRIKNVARKGVAKVQEKYDKKIFCKNNSRSAFQKILNAGGIANVIEHFSVLESQCTPDQVHVSRGAFCQNFCVVGHKKGFAFLAKEGKLEPRCSEVCSAYVSDFLLHAKSSKELALGAAMEEAIKQDAGENDALSAARAKVDDRVQVEATLASSVYAKDFKKAKATLVKNGTRMGKALMQVCVTLKKQDELKDKMKSVKEVPLSIDDVQEGLSDYAMKQARLAEGVQYLTDFTGTYWSVEDLEKVCAGFESADLEKLSMLFNLDDYDDVETYEMIPQNSFDDDDGDDDDEGEMTK